MSAKNNGALKKQNGKQRKIRIAFARRKREERIFMRFFTRIDPHFI